jgi:hypothetical protein
MESLYNKAYRHVITLAELIEQEAANEEQIRNELISSLEFHMHYYTNEIKREGGIRHFNQMSHLILENLALTRMREGGLMGEELLEH